MDWSNVTPGELWDALREVCCGRRRGGEGAWQPANHLLLLSPPRSSIDVNNKPNNDLLASVTPSHHNTKVELQAPRPLWEFCTKFSVPKNQAKWASRAKCNAYYYRSNYLSILALALLGALARTPRALLGGALGLLALLCLNDPFAAALKCVVVCLRAAVCV